jgi:hypothetical protein
MQLAINTADDNEDKEKLLKSNNGINGLERKCAHMNFEATNNNIYLTSMWTLLMIMMCIQISKTKNILMKSK